nr:hypothetical protein [Lentzea waywayandensis]
MKYFWEMPRNVPSAFQGVDRGVRLGQQRRVGLPQRQDLFAARLAGVARDLDVLRAGGGEVVEDGDVVVDDRVDPALLEQRGSLGEAFDGLHAGAGVAGDLGPVAGAGLGGGLAAQVRDRLDPVVAGAADDHAARVGVGAGETVFGGAFGVARHLVRDEVDAAGVERGEDRVPLRLDELQPPARLRGDRLDDLDVVAGQLLGLRIVEGERRVGALRADADQRWLLLLRVRRCGDDDHQQQEQHRAPEHLSHSGRVERTEQSVLMIHYAGRGVRHGYGDHRRRAVGVLCGPRR